MAKHFGNNKDKIIKALFDKYNELSTDEFVFTNLERFESWLLIASRKVDDGGFYLEILDGMSKSGKAEILEW